MICPSENIDRTVTSKNIIKIRIDDTGKQYYTKPLEYPVVGDSKGNFINHTQEGKSNRRPQDDVTSFIPRIWYKVGKVSFSRIWYKSKQKQIIKNSHRDTCQKTH